MEHSELPPDTVAIDLVDDGVVVECTDGREVLYRGVHERVETPHRTASGKQVHVLVTDASKQRGVLVSVDERRTDDRRLESSDVGRVILGPEETATLSPGVSVHGGACTAGSDSNATSSTAGCSSSRRTSSRNTPTRSSEQRRADDPVSGRDTLRRDETDAFRGCE